MIELTIKREGALLNTERHEITPAQESMVKALLKAQDLTYPELLKFLADRKLPVVRYGRIAEA